MNDEERRTKREEQRAKVRHRIDVKIDADNYEFVPATENNDFYHDDIVQRVAIYARVSTDDVRQTTSYELQKKYYEDFVLHHPNWTLVDIYADEGISGTSLKHRDSFGRMLEGCKAGKIDMIITKSVSRFARNVVDFLGTVRELASRKPPIGVFFESESIFSLNDDSQMALTFQSAMAEEESHIKSRSMETSLRMRLDNGLPLTPKLYGYSHDGEGALVVNEDEAPTVKLMFYMYLYGYSSQEIADTLSELGRSTYYNLPKWNASTVLEILKNERHCGDVYTRKTYTTNYRDHKTAKNLGQKNRSRYLNHHTAIISRDDFIAVQRMIENAKYGNKSILPELSVIESGLLKGYVIINPRWAGFKENEYFMASGSAYPETDGVQEIIEPEPEPEYHITVEDGDFDMRGFEITRSEFFETCTRPFVTFGDKKIRFSAACIHKFDNKNYVEILVHPRERKFAVRPTTKDNRNAVIWSRKSKGMCVARDIASTAFTNTLYSIFEWKEDCKYRITGSLFQRKDEFAYIFDIKDSEAYLKPYMVGGMSAVDTEDGVKPMFTSGKRIRAVPEKWAVSFGNDYYVHQKSLSPVNCQSEEDWKLRIEGRLVDSGMKINVTGFDELKQYIEQELNAGYRQEVSYE